MQLLNNVFTVCWKWKNTDIICYILTSLVPMQQVNFEKSKNLMKIVHIEGDESSYLQIFIYFLNDMRSINEISMKDVAYDNMLMIILKFTKKQGFNLSPENTFLEKTQGDWPPSLFRVNAFSNMKRSFCSFLIFGPIEYS